MNMMYICAGQGQCGKPCSPECHYTSNFFHSRLYHEQVKPKAPISFILDKYGDWWEVNFDWDKNLPDAYRKKPEELISYTYDQVVQGEIAKRLGGSKT